MMAPLRPELARLVMSVAFPPAWWQAAGEAAASNLEPFWRWSVWLALAIYFRRKGYVP